MKVYGISDEDHDGVGVFVLFDMRHKAQDYLDEAAEEASDYFDMQDELSDEEWGSIPRAFEKKFGFGVDYFNEARVVELEVRG